MYYLLVEWGDEEGESNKYYKYIKGKEEEITEAEYNELMIDGFYYLIQGWYDREEIESCLR